MGGGTPLRDIPSVYECSFDSLFHLFDSPVALQFKSNKMLMLYTMHDRATIGYDMQDVFDIGHIFRNHNVDLVFSVRNTFFCQEKFSSILGEEIQAVTVYRMIIGRAYIDNRTEDFPMAIGLSFSQKELLFGYGLIPNSESCDGLDIVFRGDLDIQKKAILVEVLQYKV
jgi:hypothetical protein